MAELWTAEGAEPQGKLGASVLFLPVWNALMPGL